MGRHSITIPKATLQKLYVENGMTMKEIAAYLDISVTPVDKNLTRYRLKGLRPARKPVGRRRLNIDAKWLKELYASNSAEAVGRIMGISTPTVFKYLEYYGIERRPPGIAFAVNKGTAKVIKRAMPRRAAIVKLKERMTLEEIGEIYGITKQRVSQLIQQYHRFKDKYS